MIDFLLTLAWLILLSTILLIISYVLDEHTDISVGILVGITLILWVVALVISILVVAGAIK